MGQCSLSTFADMVWAERVGVLLPGTQQVLGEVQHKEMPGSDPRGQGRGLFPLLSTGERHLPGEGWGSLIPVIEHLVVSDMSLQRAGQCLNQDL